MKGAPGADGDIFKQAKSGKIKVGPPPEAKGDPRYKTAFDTAAENEKRYVPIPSKYASEKSSDITYEAKSGSQTFDIELKD